MKTTARLAAVALTALFAALAAAVGLAPAASAQARLDRLEWLSDRLAVAHVYSPSMNRVIPNLVHLPVNRGAPAPALYLLHGVDGGQEGKTWFASTNLQQFFANKQVTVVSPLGGRYSLYTDWQHPDPVLGVNKWETYLTRELPSVVNSRFNGTGRNAVAGLSLSGAAALDLAIQAPHMYSAVASYSGCPQVNTPLSVGAAAAIVAFGGGNVFNAFGPPGSPAWARHDPHANADKLRGKAVYLSSATGLPGAVDGLPPLQTLSLALGPAEVEVFTNNCTRAFSARLHSLGIPNTYVQMPRGAHTWGLFEEQMRDSWRVIGPAIGA